MTHVGAPRSANAGVRRATKSANGTSPSGTACGLGAESFWTKARRRADRRNCAT